MASSQNSIRNEILQRLQNFERENGRPPRRNEPGMEDLAYLSRKHFGSWTHALNIAGMQTFKQWKRKRSFANQLKLMLNRNPMTLKEIRSKLDKAPNVSIKISSTVKQSKDIKSMGPRRFSVYFLKGQEKLAEAHLQTILGKKFQLHKEILICLKKPMTRTQLVETISELHNVRNLEYRIKKCLKELLYSRVIYQVKFIAGSRGSKKFRADELFGKISRQKYFCRYDCPRQVANLVIQSIPLKKVNMSGFRCSLSHPLKRIFPAEVFELIEKDIDKLTNC